MASEFHDYTTQSETIATKWDRVLRASVPERHKHATSPVGAVQSYIVELEQALLAIDPDALDKLGAATCTN